MAVDNFVPEWWSAELLSALRSRLVYAQPGIINTNYQGLIENAGDTVRINTISDPSVATYTMHSTSVSYAALTDTEQTLVVDQADYFAFGVDDVEAAQALDGVVEEASANAAYKMAAEIDDFVADTLYAAVNQGANDLGAKTIDISDNNAYGLLVDMRTKLSRNAVPDQGRWVIVSPEFYAALLQDNRFIDASASGSTDALRNGFVGRAAGFDVYESNLTPDPTASTYAIIAGHPMACTFAQQISKVEALRLEGSFSDGIRGLQLYGAKVLRPTMLALASATVQA
jgi:N4-gp56 family major capsid protein